MKRFLADNFASSFNYPDIFENDFGPIVSSCTSHFVGSVSETINTDIFKLGSICTRDVLSPDAISALGIFIPKIISSSAIIDVNSIFMKYSSITLKGKTFSSAGKKTKPVVAMAMWDESIYGKPPTTLPGAGERNANTRPVNVHYYANIIYSVDDSNHDAVLAFVSWFFPHPHRYALGKPAELWCKSIFEPLDYSCSFVPIKNIQCRCAHGIKEYQDEDLLVVIPLVE